MHRLRKEGRTVEADRPYQARDQQKTADDIEISFSKLYP